MARPALSEHGPGAAGPEFYVDLGHPECYLSAERILEVMSVAVPWTPVDLGPPGAVDRDGLQAAALAQGLQAIRWPAPLPFDAALANRAASYAASIGRMVAFTLAALRQAYAGARDLSLTDNVLIAASACEMHPTAVLRAVQTRGVRDTLAAATRQARARGVRRAPAVWVPDGGAGGRVFHGDSGLDDAAAVLAELTP